MRTTVRQLSPGPARRGFSAIELCGVIGVISVVLCLILAWGRGAQVRSREMSCMSNLKQIATALHLYASDHDGRLPHGQAALPYVAGTYVKNWQVLVCPSDRNPASIKTGAPETEEDDEEAGDQAASFYWEPDLPPEIECSYFIVPGLVTDDPPAELMAGETAARHRGHWNAVCLDGRAQSRPADELGAYLSARGSEGR